MAAEPRKIIGLDSVRGIAALIVVFWHWATIFYPALMSGPGSPIHSSYELTVYQSPLSFFFTGNFAVVMFFILSGFVLTVKYFSHNQGSLFPAAIKRYIRLMPVVLFSTLFGFAIMSAGWIYQLQAAGLSHSVYLGTYYNFHPSLLDALGQGSFLVFTQVWPLNVAYNPVLWTIYYEMLGAMLVFGLATLTRGQSKRWLLYIIGLVIFINTYFVGFIMGVLLADLYASKPALFERIRKARAIYKFLALMLAVCIAGYPLAGDPKTFGAYWNAITLFGSNLTDSRTILQLLAGSIFIILTLSWTRFTRFMELRPLRWLGKISYALYATHFILLYSLTCWLLVVLSKHGMAYNHAAVLALGISLPIMFVISALLHKYVEVPSINAAQKVGAWAKK